MTREEAEKMTSYKNYCNCGGFAPTMNGRNPDHPHMSWCAQFEEYEERWAALHAGNMMLPEGKEKDNE